MKKVIFLLCSLILTIACKKDSSNNTLDPDALKAPYYFKCSVDGKSVNFTNTVMCQLPAKTDTIINGVRQTSSSSLFLLQSNYTNVKNLPQIQVLITGDSNFVIKPNKIYNYPASGIICAYTPPNQNPVTGSAYFAGWEADTASINFDNNFQVVITSIDSTNATINGTFGGNTLGFDIPTMQQKIKVITDGEFFLPYKKP